METSSNAKQMHRLHVYSLFDRLVFLLYSVYFILIPFYLWQSGLPQISDFFLVILVLLYGVKRKFTISVYSSTKVFLIVGLLFVSYVTLVNLIWTILLNGSVNVGIKSLFYIYNFFITILVVALYSEYKEKILKVTFKAILLSLFIQIIIFIFEGSFTGQRMTAGFNNPNQLGYYGLIMASLLIFISSKITVNNIWFLLGIVSTFILVIASLSATAIVSYILLILFYTFFKIRDKKLQRNLIFSLLNIIIALFMLKEYTAFFQESIMIKSLEQRMFMVDSKVSGVSEQRGYYRISNYPEYWVFGSGEGEYLARFGTSLEFHSTLGNIQVSYGIIGLLLILYFIYIAVKNDGFRNWYIIVVILTYGLTHNGIRDGGFWILLAMLASSQVVKYKK